MKPIRVIEFDGKTFGDSDVGCTYMRMRKTADTEFEAHEEIGCVSWYLWNPVGWQLLDEKEIKDFLEAKFGGYLHETARQTERNNLDIRREQLPDAD